MGTALKFVKVRSIEQIPRHLFEQVRPREFDVERLYEWAPVIFRSPTNLLGAFMDREDKVHGVMWTSFNPVTNRIMVHVLSVDREYFGRGILLEVRGILNKLKRQLKADSVVGFTTRPRAIERKIGFKRSNSVIMEM